MNFLISFFRFLFKINALRPVHSGTEFTNVSALKIVCMPLEIAIVPKSGTSRNVLNKSRFIKLPSSLSNIRKQGFFGFLFA